MNVRLTEREMDSIYVAVDEAVFDGCRCRSCLAETFEAVERIIEARVAAAVAWRGGVS